MAKKTRVKTKKAPKEPKDPALTEIEGLQANNQAKLASQTAAIRARTAQQRRAQELVNKQLLEGTRTTGYRSGREQYAPDIQGGILAGEESAGLKRLEDITNNETALISEAESAAADNDYRLVSEKISLLETKRKEKATAAKELADTQAKADEEAEKAKTKQSRQGAIVGLLKQGIDDPYAIFDYVNYDDKGGVVGDISIDEITEMMDKVQKLDTTTGTVREFLDAKRKGLIDPDLKYFDYLGESAGAKESPLDKATKKAQLEKTYKEIADIGAGGGKAVKEALAIQLEFGNYYLKRPEVQLLSVSQDAFNSTKSVIGNKNPKTYSTEDAANVNEATAKTVALQLARIQNPDSARAADDGNLEEKSSLQELAKGIKDTFIQGKEVVPSKVAEAVREINSLYEGRVKAVEPINAEFKALKTKYELDVDLPGQSPTVSTPTMVTIKGKQVPVGSTITTKSGKKGRVEANGTITPL